MENINQAISDAYASKIKSGKSYSNINSVNIHTPWDLQEYEDCCRTVEDILKSFLTNKDFTGIMKNTPVVVINTKVGKMISCSHDRSEYSLSVNVKYSKSVLVSVMWNAGNAKNPEWYDDLRYESTIFSKDSLSDFVILSVADFVARTLVMEHQRNHQCTI